MIARRATDTDADAIKQYLEDFLGPGVSLEPEVLRQRMKAPQIITTISDEGYCEMKVDEKAKRIRITSLLPRGTSMEMLNPVLQEAMDETVRRYPDAATDWVFWAYFWKAVDENGKPDGGKSECLAWQSYRLDCTVYEQSGMWIIELPVRLAT